MEKEFLYTHFPSKKFFIEKCQIILSTCKSQGRATMTQKFILKLSSSWEYKLFYSISRKQSHSKTCQKLACLTLTNCGNLLTYKCHFWAWNRTKRSFERVLFHIRRKGKIGGFFIIGITSFSFFIIPFHCTHKSGHLSIISRLYLFEWIVLFLTTPMSEMGVPNSKGTSVGHRSISQS